MSKQNKFSRRKVVSALGAIGAVGVGAGFANTAAAEKVKASFTANNPDTLVNDDGSVREVNIGVSHGSISWKGLDSPAKKAKVYFCTEKDGKYETLESKELSATGLRGTNSFSFDSIDFTEDPFDDAHFESDEDGTLTETDVELKLNAEVTMQNGETVRGNTYATMTISVDNIESEAYASGEANATVGSYHQRFGAAYINEDGIEEPIEDGTLNLYVTYGKETVTYVAEFDEPEESEHSLADPEFASTNLALGWDVDEDGVGDFQVAWDPDAGFPDGEFGYSGVTDTPKWEKDTSAGWQELPEGFSAERSDNLFTFEVPRKALGEDECYKFGALAGAGGEQPYVAISNEKGKFWSGENNFTSSEYYLETEVLAGYSQLYVSDNDEICVGVVHDDSDDDHDDDSTTTFDVISPNAFDGDAPSGYASSHVELFFDFDGDGEWDTQVRRGVGEDVPDTGAGVYYQNNGGNWKSDFDGTGIAVAETDDGFSVTVDDDELDADGDTYGLGAYGTRVDDDARSETLGRVTKSGSGRPWESDNLVETSL
ncbi:hypothetical protein [Haloprofundus halobius]|uniref:hypothetical protein n=1 Tax=Haloprofundus halobius TaxID=2876194 RepID=UPI001CCCA4DE|nr:hypothetical protein [Haloprofundus halobius]